MTGILTGTNNYENVIGALLLGGDIVKIAIEGVGEYTGDELTDALDYLARHEMEPKVEFKMTTFSATGLDLRLYVSFIFRPAANGSNTHENGGEENE